MTPLTHAAVGTVICQRFEKLPWGPWRWVFAFVLSMASHYLLDSIPHFEGVVPIPNYKHNMPLMLLIGCVGAVLATLLMCWKREAGRIWLVLFLWIAAGFYTFSWWRIATAAAGLAYIAWKSPIRNAVCYAAAGMLAVLPDLLPTAFRSLTIFHRRMHYRSDWASLVYLYFSDPPVPRGSARLHAPAFLLAYGIELVIEASIFVIALYLYTRERPEKTPQDQPTESLAVSQES
ncbi:MAG: hypothetical protein HYX72_13730 [Acidobacteria bacterium]|nr:hypothetical protein [Acidobacteriota bacterium]